MGVIMTKILLVEDDKSLREIYGVRLLAEGYQIISAGDGEQALAMAVKERPDLIISDVMMPKISGFDMLDILRSTPETKDLKVIMMTALSSEDQRSRGEALGANRYLVKSQVGIEDVVRTVHDVLADSPIAPAPTSQMFATRPLSAAIPPRPAQPSAPTPTFTPSQAPITPIDPGADQEPIQVATSTIMPAAAPATENIAPTPPPIVIQPQPEVAPAAPIMENIDPTTPPIVNPTQPVVTPVPVQFQNYQPTSAPTPIPTPIQVSAPVAQVTPVMPSQFETAPQPSQAPEPYVSPEQKTVMGDRVINPISVTPDVDIAALINQELNGPSAAPMQSNQPPYNPTNQI